MKVSREQVAENRQRILGAASQLFRTRGFEAVTVAEIMRAAGLTHGGFYGYFTSKDDLIAQTLAHTLGNGPQTEVDLNRYARSYLSPSHRDNFAEGCLTAGLAAETIRAAPEARAAMTAGLRRQIDRLAQGAPGNTPTKKRRAAIGSWSTMVGALMLSRLCDDPKLSDEILAQTRAWIGEQNTDIE